MKAVKDQRYFRHLYFYQTSTSYLLLFLFLPNFYQLKSLLTFTSSRLSLVKVIVYFSSSKLLLV
jgi:hypothetical protein